MDSLPEVIVAVGLVAFVLNLLWKAGTRQSQTALSLQEAFLPAAEPPGIKQARMTSDPGPAISGGGSDTQGRHLFENPQHGRGSDPTRDMMDAMSGPGVCTPPA